jgi:nitrite reductase/ring-hydroxylating ferredoxin subunit
MQQKTRNRAVDEGTAYGRAQQHHDAEITEVAAGTPCGEFMRRYWHPVALASSLGPRPQNVRILGEDLILFRDRKGRPGLLYPRCAHRGTTLYYGRIEDEGIRCCYHGWLFDVEGRCLDQPCEPEGGRQKGKVRQPWYPVEERYGLVFAYLGPPEKKPVLPRWDCLESLAPGERIVADGASTGGGGDDTVEIIPTNWLNDWENVMDPFHVPILHTSFSGVQFVPEMGVMPEVTWEHADFGMRYTAYRKLEDGREMDRVTQVLFPHVRIVPDVRLLPGKAARIGWVVPVDDTHYRLFHAGRIAADQVPRSPRHYDGRKWSELSEDEHQRFPGDWEAQVGQGAVSLHSEEHLTSTDKGVAMLRRLLRRQIKAVEGGGDPLGVAFEQSAALVTVQAGNFYRK